jgi:hypothetical protein
MFVVSLLGLLINIVGLCFFHHHSHHDEDASGEEISNDAYNVLEEQPDLPETKCAVESNETHDNYKLGSEHKDVSEISLRSQTACHTHHEHKDVSEISLRSQTACHTHHEHKNHSHFNENSEQDSTHYQS